MNAMGECGKIREENVKGHFEAYWLILIMTPTA